METERLDIIRIGDGFGLPATGGFEHLIDDFRANGITFLIQYNEPLAAGIERAVRKFKTATARKGSKPVILAFAGIESFTIETLTDTALALKLAADTLVGLRLILCLPGDFEACQALVNNGLPRWFIHLWERVILTPGSTDEARLESLSAMLRAVLLRPVIPVPEVEILPLFVAGSGAVLLVANPNPEYVEAMRGE